ncbi:MAG: hypothetical protein J5701_08445 [Bacteroidales bacterium]|nr:hypothetical protein [Bacteroidales bacterium]
MKKDLYNDAQKALKAYDKMESYRIQEDILQRLVHDYPNHKNKAAVEVKVKLLNLLYSTYILATNRMTEHIFGIKNIDARLKKGENTLVKEIALLSIDGKSYDFYSFATKYCAYHNPTSFPIYDNIVANVLTKLFEDGNLSPYTYTTKKNVANGYSKALFQEKLRDYDFFLKVYDTFMKEYGLWGKLTYREVDAYLWGAYKIAGKDFEIEKIAPIDKRKIIEVEI